MTGDQHQDSPFAETSKAAVEQASALIIASGPFLPSSPVLSGAPAPVAEKPVQAAEEKTPAPAKQAKEKAKAKPAVKPTAEAQPDMFTADAPEQIEQEAPVPLAPKPDWVPAIEVAAEEPAAQADSPFKKINAEEEAVDEDAAFFKAPEPILDDPFSKAGSMLAQEEKSTADAPAPAFSLSKDTAQEVKKTSKPATARQLDLEEDVEPVQTQMGGDSAEAGTLPKANVVFYTQVLRTLLQAKDLGIDAVAKARIEDLIASGKMPQLICRDLVNERVINRIQLARAVARSQQRREITSFLDVPQESINMRRDLDRKVCNLLRERRVIPLKRTEVDSNHHELHLAHESALRDHMLEAALRDIMPGYSFVWHFAMREVAGAYWLAGESEDIDAGMEAEALLDRLISNAVDARSSDIHIDPSIKGEPRAIVKYRIDGSIQPKEVITLDQLERLRVRIENMDLQVDKRRV